MANLKLKGKDLLKLGFPNNQSINVALEVMKRNYATKNLAYVKSVLEDILKNPAQYEGHLTFGQIAEALLSSTKTEKRQLNATRVRLITSLATTSPKKQKRNSIWLSNFPFQLAVP